MKLKPSKSRIAFQIFNYVLMLLATFVCVYPFWYIVIYTFSDSAKAGINSPVFLPRGFSVSNYADIFKLSGFFPALGISVLRTVGGTIAAVLVCAFLGYMFTKEEMPGRKLLYRFLVMTMYINGGLISTFIVMKSYGLLNTFWIYILPMLISAYNIVLIKTYMESLPASLEESAMLDGAGYIRVFTSIILPLSKPIIATVAVFVAVGHWNSWFDVMLYNSSGKWDTLQVYLRKILLESEQASRLLSEQKQYAFMKNLTTSSIRAATTMIVTIPIVCIYPFLQKYFVGGITIGAVKG